MRPLKSKTQTAARASVTPARNHRQAVEFLLAVFAERTTPQCDELGVPVQATPLETCRRWFDDVYLPSSRYFDAVKGEIDITELQQFSSQFSEDEFLQLERFHRFLELRLDLLQKTGTAPEAWKGSPAWKYIAQNAKNTLELLQGGFCGGREY